MNIFRKEFSKKHLYSYLILNILLIINLTFEPLLKFFGKKGIISLLIIFFLLLLLFLFLLIDFILIIPNTNAGLTKMTIGSLLLLSLIILTYANLYLEIYRLKGKHAFVFSRKELAGNDFLYFSVETFTTTGYGDITSIGLLSNAVAASEMLLGMICNTIFMAIITSKIIKKLNH